MIAEERRSLEEADLESTRIKFQPAHHTTRHHTGLGGSGVGRATDAPASSDLMRPAMSPAEPRTTRIKPQNQTTCSPLPALRDGGSPVAREPGLAARIFIEARGQLGSRDGKGDGIKGCLGFRNGCRKARSRALADLVAVVFSCRLVLRHQFRSSGLRQISTLPERNFTCVPPPMDRDRSSNAHIKGLREPHHGDREVTVTKLAHCRADPSLLVSEDKRCPITKVNFFQRHRRNRAVLGWIFGFCTENLEMLSSQSFYAISCNE
mmetsp:Transcript_40077/g.107351  ORF Transcript_40077/g.107351 Transcript_40077/m.107351 type:complete len:264 (-) Transcript_40077:1169-1960(-)